MLPVTQLLIASEDSSFTHLLCSAIPSSGGLAVTGIYPSGIGLMDAVRNEKPDILLMDFLLPGVNALTILHELNLLPVEECPAVYILSSFASPETVAECDRLGVSFFLRKPMDIVSLVDLMMRYGTSARHVQPELKVQLTMHDISMRVTQILSSLHVPAHVAGYRYVRECILLTLTDATMSESVTKILYPAVAKRYNTAWTSVERDIRNAIEIAWKRCGGRMPGFGPVRRPANREFIHTIADRVRFELHIDADTLFDNMALHS